MPKAPKIGECPCCNSVTYLTNHHILPKRFFGGCGPLKLICRPCHDGLEQYIPQNDKMPDDFYPMIFEWFCERRKP